MGLVVILFSLTTFVISAYKTNSMQPESAVPDGNSLFWGFGVSFVILAGILYFMVNSKLTTEIWTDGIRYSFPPLLRRERFIPLSEIKGAEVQKYKPIMEFGGWGWRVKFISRKTAYNVSGNKGLRVFKIDGSQVLFGTRQSEELSNAVNAMLQFQTRSMK